MINLVILKRYANADYSLIEQIVFSHISREILNLECAVLPLETKEVETREEAEAIEIRFLDLKVAKKALYNYILHVPSCPSTKSMILILF